MLRVGRDDAPGMKSTALTATAAAALMLACGSALGADMRSTAAMHPTERAASVKDAAMAKLDAAPTDISGAPLGEGDRVADHRTMRHVGTVVGITGAGWAIVRWDNGPAITVPGDTVRVILAANRRRELGDTRLGERDDVNTGLAELSAMLGRAFGM